MHGTYLQDWLLRPDDDNWRVDAELGGASRAFADIGSHWCDLAEFVTGHRIARLSARKLTAMPSAARSHRRRSRGAAAGRPAGGTEDAAVVQFETDQGAVGSTVISQISGGPQEPPVAGGRRRGGGAGVRPGGARDPVVRPPRVGHDPQARPRVPVRAGRPPGLAAGRSPAGLRRLLRRVRGRRVRRDPRRRAAGRAAGVRRRPAQRRDHRRGARPRRARSAGSTCLPTSRWRLRHERSALRSWRCATSPSSTRACARSTASTSTCCPGEVHVLLGPNGAGKSTLIKCVSGAVAPSEGEILVEGEPLPTGEPSESMARGVGDDLPGARPRRGPDGRRERVPRPRDPPRRAAGPRARCGARPRRCSSGWITRTSRRTRGCASLRPAGQQIVSIARALSRKIRLLIMDEPSAILDDHEIETLFGVVRRLTAEGVGVIYISHRLDEVKRIGDRVTVLSDGRTVAVGLPADTPQDDARRAHGRPQGRAAVPRAREARRRRAARGARRRAAPGRQAGVASRCTPARCVGIGGLVGAGRTELLRLIYGLDPPTRARSCVDGKRLPGGRPDAAIAAGLGLAPEDRKSQGLLLGVVAGQQRHAGRRRRATGAAGC